MYFRAPFLAVMVAATVYGGFLAHVFFASQNRLFEALLALGTFCCFCVAWTVGRSAWDAHHLGDAAVVIDAGDITDLQADEPHAVPWEAIARAQLDYERDPIVIKLRASETACARGVVVKPLQRRERERERGWGCGGIAQGPVAPPAQGREGD